MARKKLTPNQYEQTLAANAHVCCVCKRRGIGVNVHHIDHNASNNDRENLAVLCVQEHDAHHRPVQYPALNHLDLSADELRRHKRDWEEFVAEAQKPEPDVLAVMNVYGSLEQIHSARLLVQWSNGQVVLERLYHLLEGPPDVWIDRLIEEVGWLGKRIKLVLVNEPLAIEYCPCCGRSLANVIDPGCAKMLTAADWPEKSVCSIYVNPTQASLAVHISYGTDGVISAALHKCGRHLHLAAGHFEERVPIRRKPSIRAQATSLVRRFVSEWRPGKVLIGTGDSDQPDLIDDLKLPSCWERRRD
jgi:hypothetical protein